MSCAHSNTSLVRFIFAQSFFSFLCNGCRQLSLSDFWPLLVGTISNVLVMEIGWTDVGSGGIT